MNIYKYKIQDDSVTPTRSSIHLPQGAKVLTAGLDDNHQLCVWAEVNPAAVEQRLHFQTVWTGQEAPARQLSYLGMVKSGVIILHVYWVQS